MEHLPQKWFAIYYPVLGLLFMGAGTFILVKTKAVVHYLSTRANHEQPPVLVRTILKYFFLFTLPCLIFSFIPFSWTELLFSFWSLIIVYIVGIQLVRWPQTRQSIKNHPKALKKIIKIMGAVMLAVGPVMFLLCYLVIRKIT